MISAAKVPCKYTQSLAIQLPLITSGCELLALGIGGLRKKRSTIAISTAEGLEKEAIERTAVYPSL